MTRALRIQYEGAWYHVMNRGLERRNIFLNNNHKKLFLDLLSEISERFQVDIHVYCLMDNHYHLLIQTQLPNLNLVMKHLNGVYTLRLNRDIKRDGPLFRGRYKSVLIDKDNYLLNVSRYIHKNPSSAKLTTDDQKYLWSSYQYYNLNKDNKPKWLATKELLNFFNGNAKEYVSFVEKGSNEEINKFYSSKRVRPILGCKSFIKDMSDKFFKEVPNKHISNRDQIISTKYPSLEETLLMISKKYEVSSDYILRNEARNYVFERSLLIHLLSFNPRYNLVEKGKFLGISDDAISKSGKRFLDRLKMDKELREEVCKVEKEFYGQYRSVGT
jgi:putative transposase